MTEDDHGRANVRRGGLTKRGIEPFELSLRQPRVLRQRQAMWVRFCILTQAIWWTFLRC